MLAILQMILEFYEDAAMISLSHARNHLRLSHELRFLQPVPLAPMMAELPFSMIDILEDEPERLSTVDFDELREDMD